MNAHYSLAGEYRVVVASPQGEKDTGWFKNVVTDIGLDYLGTSGGETLEYCRVGTGTSTPATGQTALDAQVAVRNGADVSTTNAGSPTYASLETRTFTFAQGAVVGNISELGVGWSATGSSLFSRARILDGVGSPTTITLTSLDQLTVYYRVRITPILTDAAGSVSIGGTTYTYTSRLAYSGSFGQFFPWTTLGRIGKLANQSALRGAGCSLGAITGTLAGGSAVTNPATTGNTAAAYVSGNYYIDNTLTWGINNGNASGGVQGLQLDGSNNSSNSGVHWQYLFNAAIPKDNTKILTLTFRVSWGR